MGTSQTYSINESADFWRYDIGVNVLGADTKNEKALVTSSEWQNKPITEELSVGKILVIYKPAATGTQNLHEILFTITIKWPPLQLLSTD
jgi:hypothetical protein